MNITLTLRTDSVTPDIRRALAAGRGPWLLAAGAKEMTREIKSHLRELQGRGNRRGWPSKKFFAGRPDSVANRVGISRTQPGLVVVTIADPRFAHRITGGTVTPKRGQYLAIPLTAEAYRRSGSGSLRNVWPELQVFSFKSSTGLKLFLGTTKTNAIKTKIEKQSLKGLSGWARERAKIENRTGVSIYTHDRLQYFFHFKLVRSVTHAPRPGDAPDEGRVGLAAITAMERAATLLISKSAA